MKKIKVRIENPTKLVLEEDASKGDFVDLNELLKVDQSMILESIRVATDSVYENKLKEEKNKANTQKEKEKLELKEELTAQLFDLRKKLQDEQNTISQLQEKIEAEKENVRLTTIQSKTEEYQKKEQELNNKINELKNQLEVVKSIQDSSIENQKITLESKHKELMNKKESQIEMLNEKLLELKISKEMEIEKTKLEATQILQKQVYDKEHELNNLQNLLKASENEHNMSILEKENYFQKQIAEKEKQIEIITREKALRNVKQIGENLENWCNEKYKSVNIFGFKSSTWEKDNTSVKGLGESKGTKGDYVFKVYTDSEEKYLLTSAMCEMKSEALESENKKRNSDHYKKLDEDRKKKKLEYAILISELEYEVESDAPIFTVNEYEKMYVVRPQYFITLLGIIESIGLKFSELVTTKKREEHEFEDISKILSDFEEFKDSIITKSFKHISTNMENIKISTNKIISSAEDIIKSVDVVVNTHLITIKNKIENYSIKSLTRKIDKLS